MKEERGRGREEREGGGVREEGGEGGREYVLPVQYSSLHTNQQS